jgi:hypothetical protein
VRLTVGAVKTQSRIIPQELNPEWNQVFAVGGDKIHGGRLELSVWDAVILYSSFCNYGKQLMLVNPIRKKTTGSLPADKCESLSIHLQGDHILSQFLTTISGA